MVEVGPFYHYTLCLGSGEGAARRVDSAPSLLNFADLPPELLLAILERLGAGALIRVNRVNKLLHATVLETDFGKRVLSLDAATRRSRCFFIGAPPNLATRFACSVNSQASGVTETVEIDWRGKERGKTIVSSVPLEASERVLWVFLYSGHYYQRPCSLHSSYFDGVYCVKSLLRIEENEINWRSIFNTCEGYVFALETHCKAGRVYSLGWANDAPYLRRET